MIHSSIRQTLLAFALFLTIISSTACSAAKPIVANPTVKPTDAPSATLTTAPTATFIPTPTPTDEPTSTPEPTPTPALGQVNDANQWWDGAGWQALPEGEGWQLTVADGGQVRAINADGVEYVFEANSWIKASESYSHIQLAPDGTALQEYLNASGARVQPAIHIGNGAFELVPAGAVLPTHIYEANTGSWREVDPNKAIIEDVDTSIWLTSVGSPGSLFEGLQMPMRMTTTAVPHLREIISYAPSVEEYFMVQWLRMCHVAHTYQQRGRGETVDFETYVEMVKEGDPDAQIYVYKYDLNPDGTRGDLRQQIVDPAKGVTIQAVYDSEFEHHSLVTVATPNKTGIKNAFRLGATEAGQAAIVLNVNGLRVEEMTTSETLGERLKVLASDFPTSGMRFVAMFATGYMMQNPDVNAPGFKQIGEDVSEAEEAAGLYIIEDSGYELESLQDSIDIKFD